MFNYMPCMHPVADLRVPVRAEGNAIHETPPPTPTAVSIGIKQEVNGSQRVDGTRHAIAVLHDPKGIDLKQRAHAPAALQIDLRLHAQQLFMRQTQAIDLQQTTRNVVTRRRRKKGSWVKNRKRWTSATAAACEMQYLGVRGALAQTGGTNRRYEVVSEGNEIK